MRLDLDKIMIEKEEEEIEGKRKVRENKKMEGNEDRDMVRKIGERKGKKGEWILDRKRDLDID